MLQLFECFKVKLGLSSPLSITITTIWSQSCSYYFQSGCSLILLHGAERKVNIPVPESFRTLKGEEVKPNSPADGFDLKWALTPPAAVLEESGSHCSI